MGTETSSIQHNKPFQFTGDSWEYFKIWIVNIFLTILTLGVYSAWAKVRNKRYFYGNTQVDGSSFEYLANPIAILKGRLIAFAVFMAYFVSVSFQPLAEPVFLIAFIIALPWLVIRSLTFNARNSAFRNVRFDFKGRYGEAIKLFFGLPLLNIVTLGLAYPYYAHQQKRFVVANSGYGTTGFQFQATVGNFYGVYLRALGMLVLVGLAYLAVNYSSLMSLAQAVPPQAPAPTPMPIPPQQAIALMLPMLLILPFYLWIGTYTHAATANLTFNGAINGEHGFVSSLRTRGLFWIYLTNLVAMVVSLGLLIPWAKVRLARYRCERLQLKVAGDLDQFIAHQRDMGKATGEELAEMFDVDLGL